MMIRYRKLGYVELNVTDLDRARTYYEEVVGLQFVGLGSTGELLFRCSDDHHTVALHRSKEAGFKRAGWMLEDASQFDVVRRVLDPVGVDVDTLSHDECAARFLGRAVRIVEPHTHATIEFYLPQESTQRFTFVPTRANIQRLGHVVFSTPHYEQAVTFFRDILNFHESDIVGDFVTFFRAFPNPYHHGVGIARASRPHFHHLNFMVSDVDDVGRGIHRLRNNNVPVVYGPGRHPASSSVFLYFLDPDGLTLEYSFGMEEFPEFGARAARRFPGTNESLDSWGSPRDERFASVGTIEQRPKPAGRASPNGSAGEGMAMAYDLENFCVDLNALLTAKGRDALPEITEKLRGLLVNPAFVAATFDDAMPPGQRVLHHDPQTDAYVLAHVQAPGKQGTPHGHGPSWAIYGNARGTTEMTEWRRINPPGDDHAELAATEHYQLGPGQSRAYGLDAIHSTAHPEKAWVVRVTGTNLDLLARWRFDRTRDRIVEGAVAPS